MVSVFCRSNSFSMPYSYQQVLTSNINSNSNNSSNSINNGSINSNIPYSNTGNSLYNHATAPTATYSSNSAWSAYQATAGLPTQYITQPAASPANGTNKKPNVSRFSAPISNAEQSTATSKTADKQPASLKDFVKRSFAMCSSDAERTYVSTELQKLISKVTADGRLHVHKWEFEPTPKYVPPESVSSSSFNASTVLSSSRTSSAQPPAELSKKEKKRRSRFESTDKASQQTATFVVNDNETKKKPVLAGVEKLATTEELKMRESRANRFQVASNVNANSTTGRQKRRKSQVTVRVPVKADSSITSAEFDIESLKIVGTCEKLEKDYLRLTSPPDPSVVRPEHVLRKTIQLLKKKWSNEEVDYVYMCSQLKSIRQDLTVQHIQNSKKFSATFY